MSQIFDMTTLITIAVAVFVLLRLRAVLGKRTGHQRPPFDPKEIDRNLRGKNDVPEEGLEEGNVVSLPDRGGVKPKKSAEEVPNQKAIDEYAKPGTKLNRGLREIARSDPSFTPEAFLDGAKMAYEMIVTAYADGDRKTLKNLLSREVYDGFAAAISERENRGETVQSTFVGIENARIKSAEIVNQDAQISVQFVSQIISATIDKDGEIIDGDPDQVAEVNDVWTFARDTRSRDPNWKLVATESDG